MLSFAPYPPTPNYHHTHLGLLPRRGWRVTDELARRAPHLAPRAQRPPHPVHVHPERHRLGRDRQVELLDLALPLSVVVGRYACSVSPMDVVFIRSERERGVRVCERVRDEGETNNGR